MVGLAKSKKMARTARARAKGKIDSLKVRSKCLKQVSRKSSLAWKCEKARERLLSDNRKSSHDSVHLDDEAASWQWTDEEQIIFRSVTRINVHDRDAAQRVTEARLNGIPVCLVGHRGWPQFAERWLQQPNQKHASTKRNSDWIDLSQPHRVNVRRMINDVGHEQVPLLRPDYDEANPCKEKISIADFLRKYWTGNTDDAGASCSKRSPPKGYMHQWQFPLSETAAAKLCEKTQSLPNGIFGEDLLRYWLDQGVCGGDSPFQYLFMGGAGTMSKLHRDNGGLTISIAPIVGEKECVMVHRSDGASCMYHLAATLDEIDLHRFPMMSYARIWKTVVHPGEILIMPQGTYHQCRNVTPCLSYSRFHLDTVNLRPFLESWINRDAKEIDHGEVIWNASCELWQRLDRYVKEVQSSAKSKVSVSTQRIPHEITQTVNVLRALRHVCRAIAQRLNALNCEDTTDASDRRHWNDIVNDIDLTLHEFRYRRQRPAVPFSPRQDRLSPDCDDMSMTPSNARNHSRSPTLTKQMNSASGSDPESHRTTGFIPKMDEVLARLPSLDEEEKGCTIPDSIQLGAGTPVVVRFNGKRIKGIIVEVVDNMQAAYISFEGYGSCYDEYQSFQCLRTPMSGDFSGEVDKGYVKEGAVVLNRWGEGGEEYRAVVLHTRSGTFYLAVLTLGRCQIQRWITREMVINQCQQLLSAERTTQSITKSAQREQLSRAQTFESPRHISSRFPPSSPSPLHQRSRVRDVHSPHHVSSSKAWPSFSRMNETEVSSQRPFTGLRKLKERDSSPFQFQSKVTDLVQTHKH